MKSLLSVVLILAIVAVAAVFSQVYQFDAPVIAKLLNVAGLSTLTGGIKVGSDVNKVLVLGIVTTGDSTGFVVLNGTTTDTAWVHNAH
jgi:hypothetical protein